MSSHPRSFKRGSSMIKPRLKGKVALITGGNRGIGLAIAKALAAEGCKLIITGRDQSALNKATKALSRFKVEVLSVVCDVRDAVDVGALFATVEGHFHRLDILINNAGISQPGLSVQKLPLQTWKDVIDINLTGTFLVTQTALPLMKRGSIIVNNLSVAAKQVFVNSSAYNASKHGALGFTNSLREELREKGIRVIALLPGATDTDIWNLLWPDAPRQKMMSPETVAAALVNALTLAENSTVEELTIRPSIGSL